MTETIAIIDYGSGNLRSAAKAFEHVVEAEKLPYRVIVTGDAIEISHAAKLVLPGQGAFGDCMAGLKASGLVDILQKRVLREYVPFLGICVGMQLMAEQGFEYGEYEGLGWIKGQVRKIKSNNSKLKIPHMGWNDLTYLNSTHPALQHLSLGDHFYFVHSFMFESKDTNSSLAIVDYGGTIPAIIGRDNMIGAQFHPEKSQEAGMRLIKGFLNWKYQG